LQIKVCGICCLLSAVLCVIVTVTTTVIHMNRLQTLRECVYTQKSQACTCYSGLTQDPSITSEESELFIYVFILGDAPPPAARNSQICKFYLLPGAPPLIFISEQIAKGLRARE